MQPREVRRRQARCNVHRAAVRLLYALGREPVQLCFKHATQVATYNRRMQRAAQNDEAYATERATKWQATQRRRCAVRPVCIEILLECRERDGFDHLRARAFGRSCVPACVRARMRGVRAEFNGKDR